MKRRVDITHALRDRWIEIWKLENQRSPHWVSFIKSQDMKSSGSKSRTPDFAEPGQDRDLLSTNERHFFYRLRFSGELLWIKEQYPLLSLERSAAIAKQLGVRHPTYPYTANVQVVMTSDFYCRSIIGNKIVYSIKDSEAYKKLTKRQKANLEIKLKIEQVFWESQGVKWHLIMSEDIKTIFSQNLEQLFSFYSIDLKLTILLPRWLSNFESLIKDHDDISLSDLISELADQINLSYQDSVAIFEHCIWHKKIIADLNQLLRFEKSVAEFQLRVNAYG